MLKMNSEISCFVFSFKKTLGDIQTGIKECPKLNQKQPKKDKQQNTQILM